MATKRIAPKLSFTSDFEGKPFQVAYDRAEKGHVVVEVATGVTEAGFTGYQEAYSHAAGRNYVAALAEAPVVEVITPELVNDVETWERVGAAPCEPVSQDEPLYVARAVGGFTVEAWRGGKVEMFGSVDALAAHIVANGGQFVCSIDADGAKEAIARRVAELTEAQAPTPPATGDEALAQHLAGECRENRAMAQRAFLAGQDADELDAAYDRKRAQLEGLGYTLVGPELALAELPEAPAPLDAFATLPVPRILDHLCDAVDAAREKAAEVADEALRQRWLNAIDAAWEHLLLAEVVEFNPATGALRYHSESGQTYEANGTCQCVAHQSGQPCKHRAGAKLVKNAVARATEALAITLHRQAWAFGRSEYTLTDARGDAAKKLAA